MNNAREKKKCPNDFLKIVDALNCNWNDNILQKPLLIVFLLCESHIKTSDFANKTKKVKIYVMDLL